MERHVWHNLFLVKPDSASQAQLLQLCRYVERQWISKASIAVPQGFLCVTVRRVQITPWRVFTLVCVGVYRWSIQTCSPFSAICNALLSTLSRGMLIRRAKKRGNLTNDARIKACLNRFDNGGCTRIQFLRAVSHSLGGAHVPCDGMEQSDSDDADDVPTASSNVAASAAVPPPDLCEVCLVEERDARHALVPCGHQRFCASCAALVEEEGRGCPLCRTPITMMLRLY